MMNREPVLIITAVQAAVALAVSFGLGLTSEQAGALMATVSAILGLVMRHNVSPVGKEAPLDK